MGEGLKEVLKKIEMDEGEDDDTFLLHRDDDNMYKLDEFCDAAIIGHTHDASKYVYDYDQCMELFMARERWSEEEAIEWMEYNVISQNLAVFICSKQTYCSEGVHKTT